MKGWCLHQTNSLTSQRQTYSSLETACAKLPVIPYKLKNQHSVIIYSEPVQYYICLEAFKKLIKVVQPDRLADHSDMN